MYSVFYTTKEKAKPSSLTLDFEEMVEANVRMELENRKQDDSANSIHIRKLHRARYRTMLARYRNRGIGR